MYKFVNFWRENDHKEETSIHLTLNTTTAEYVYKAIMVKRDKGGNWPGVHGREELVDSEVTDVGPLHRALAIDLHSDEPAARDRHDALVPGPSVLGGVEIDEPLPLVGPPMLQDKLAATKPHLVNAHLAPGIRSISD